MSETYESKTTNFIDQSKLILDGILIIILQTILIATAVTQGTANQILRGAGISFHCLPTQGLNVDLPVYPLSFRDN